MICVTKHQIKLNCDIDTLTISLSNNHPHELYYTQKKKIPIALNGEIIWIFR